MAPLQIGTSLLKSGEPLFLNPPVRDDGLVWVGLTNSGRRECFCNYQFNVKACSVQGIFKTSDVIKNDRESLACPANTVNLMSELSPFLILMSTLT